MTLDAAVDVKRSDSRDEGIFEEFTECRVMMKRNNGADRKTVEATNRLQI